MLESLPGVRVMSEPWALACLLNTWRRGRLETERYHRLMESCLKLQCKPEQPAVTHVVIKLTNACNAHISDIRSLTITLFIHIPGL